MKRVKVKLQNAIGNIQNGQGTLYHVICILARQLSPIPGWNRNVKDAIHFKSRVVSRLLCNWNSCNGRNP